MHVKSFGHLKTYINLFLYFMCPVQWEILDPKIYWRHAFFRKQSEIILISLAQIKLLQVQSYRSSAIEWRFLFLLFNISRKVQNGAPVMPKAFFVRSQCCSINVIMALPKFFGIFFVSFLLLLLCFLHFFRFCGQLRDSEYSENSDSQDSSLQLLGGGGGGGCCAVGGIQLNACFCNSKFLLISIRSWFSMFFLTLQSSLRRQVWYIAQT